MQNLLKTIDLKDRKILFELEQESDQSLGEIAKKVRLRKETVFYRIRNLEARGLIKSYLTEINIYKIGYQFYSVLFRYQNTNPDTENEIFDCLKGSSRVAWLTKCEGAWDINITLITKGNFGLEEFFDWFMEKYSEYIAEKQVFITTEVNSLRRGFGLGRRPRHMTTIGPDGQVPLGTGELRILSAISANARMPLVEISKSTKLSPRAVARSIKRMSEEGIIQGSRLLVDFSKLGYKFYKIWFALKKMTPDNYKKLLAHFNGEPSVIWVTKLIGRYDLSVEIEAESTEEFRSILDNIKLRFSDMLKQHESVQIFEEELLSYFPKEAMSPQNDYPAAALSQRVLEKVWRGEKDYFLESNRSGLK